MKIQAIYEELKRERLVRSAYDFSQNYMGRDRSYFAVLKARAKEPSIESWQILGCALQQRAIAFGRSDYQPVRDKAVKLAKLQADIAAALMSECAKRLR
jgi:hypothetical protein